MSISFSTHISLKPYNTFGIDTYAKYFTETSTQTELIECIKQYKELAKEKVNFPLLLLGGGSNIVFTKNFEGLVIKICNKGIIESQKDENHVIVTARAGENWHEFVMFCLKKNYGGLENLSLIPGNVGTSPMQNIGAYGVEIKDVFFECKALNIDTEQIETFNREDCEFGYRESIFKTKAKGKYIILEVSFILTTQRHKIKTDYGAIQQELIGISNPSIQDISKAVIRIRESKLPNPKTFGNAGSFFKNPTIPVQQFQNLSNQFESIPNYPTKAGIKIPAAWLIEQCSWKGTQIENVASHHLQPLVIINKTGSATGEEVHNFSEKIIQSVLDKFGILLEREVNIV